MAHFKRSIIAIPSATFAIIFSLTGAPTVAFGATSAELQQQLDSTQEKLNELYSSAEQAENDLVTVKNNLAKTQRDIKDAKSQIEKTKAELIGLQSELDAVVSEQYKGGGASLLSPVLSSNDFSSLLSNIYYANKVANYQESVISKFKQLQQTLEEKSMQLERNEAKQERLVASQQLKSDAAEKAASEAQAYYDSLSVEFQEKIAEEEAAAREKARQEAEAQSAAALAAAEQQNAAQQRGNSSTSSDSTAVSSGDSSSSADGGTAQTPPAPSTGGGASNSSNSSSPATPSKSMTPSYSSGVASFVARAQSIIGSGYSYSGYRWTGSTSTSVFTCSGVVDYALGLGPKSNSPEGLYRKVSIITDVNQLKYGDLVFFNTSRWCGHVGIYIGGGMMIDSIPGAGVGIRSLDYIDGFIGGGSIV